MVHTATSSRRRWFPPGNAADGPACWLLRGRLPSDQCKLARLTAGAEARHPRVADVHPVPDAFDPVVKLRHSGVRRQLAFCSTWKVKQGC